jgi:rare lipoprotein A
MRLPADAGFRLLALGLTAAVAACGVTGGGERVAPLAVAAPAAIGPGADYPMVLGDPFTVEGEPYTPADTLNYDAVGYAAMDDGLGVTAAHRTLPLPSYAEVTSLESGKTILVRVERRGPMTGKNLIALGPAAAAQLGVGTSAPVRVRRVNPIEAERAELRARRAAPERMETPKSLVEVLRRKLPVAGMASLRGDPPAGPGRPTTAANPARAAAAPSSPAGAPAPVTTRPVPPPAVQTAPATPASAAPILAGKVGFVVQAGAFASRANADRAAKALDGSVSPSGRLYRVRTGPFASRGQAEAALAKARSAGYSDARVYTAD